MEVKRPANLIYSVDERPPLLELILLGLQYTCMMIPYLIIIVILDQGQGRMTSSPISFGLIALAIAVLLQAAKKGPVGSGYLAPPTLSSIYFPVSVVAVKAGGLHLLYGMTIFGGVVQCVFAFFLERLRKLFPPIVCGLIMMAVGFQLGLLALSQIFSVNDLKNPMYDRYFLAGVISIFTMIPLTIWAKGLWRLLSPFIGILVGFVFSYFAGILSPAALEKVAQASWIAFPEVSGIGYEFSWEMAWPFVLAGIAASLRTIGGITSSQKINNAAWIQPDMKNVRKGVLADGLGCAIGGILGVPAVNTAPSLVGVAEATGATSRIIAVSFAAWLIALSFLPKIIFLFLTIPLSVMGASLLFSASFMIAGGLEVIASRKIDTKAVVIIGLSLLLGVSQQVYADFYSQVPPVLKILTNSLLSVITLSAFLLNLLFRIGARQTVVLQEQKKTLDELGKEWGWPSQIIARMESSSEALTRLVKAGYLKEGDIHLTVISEPVEAILKFKYQGDLPKLQFDIEEEKKMIEETPYVLGLSNFLTGIFADSTKSSKSGSDCSISLYFHI